MNFYETIQEFPSNHVALLVALIKPHITCQNNQMYSHGTGKK